MANRRIGNAVAGAAGTAVALLTMYISWAYLRRPQSLLDYAALVFSGLTTGIIVFFVVWGHFQRDPEPGKPE